MTFSLVIDMDKDPKRSVAKLTQELMYLANDYGVCLSDVNYHLIQLLPANPVIPAKTIHIMRGEDPIYTFTVNNKFILNSYDDEPAIIAYHPNFDLEIWARNGELHRYSGPAVLSKDRSDWFIYGTHYCTQNDFKENAPEKYHEDFLAGLLVYDFH